MLTLAEARERALSLMRSRPQDLAPGDELVLVDDDTIEREWGWMFFFASRRWRETGDSRWENRGEGPLIINRHDGSVHLTGTRLPAEHYLTRYETEFQRNRAGWLLVLMDLDLGSREARQALGQVLDLRAEELTELYRRLPAVVMEGPRAQIQLAHQELLTAGIRAEVRRGA
jgi:hypothetical protein